MKELKYNCQSCCFHTPFKTRYDSHLLTKRHINKNNTETKQEYQYICQKCNKTFKSNSGLWSHKNKCNPKKIEVLDVSMKDTIINEIHNIMKNNPSQTIINNPPTIIQNQQTNNFNVNLFLNENLTQAKNFIDMIQNISVKGPYPDEISSDNYVQCVVDMITTEMDKIPIDERPIHCIKDEDEHQKILHIRHQNKWKKELELEWTSQIHNGYFDTEEENKKEQKIIFTGIKQLEDNIITEIEKLNDMRKKSEYSSEISHPPNKVLIIKCLLDYVNIDKVHLLQIIDQAYSTKSMIT